MPKVQIAEKKRPRNVMVVNNQPKLIHFGSTVLKPGVNSVPEKIAKQMAAHPHIKGLVGIEFSTDAPSTTKLEPAKAKALVAKTHDPKLLDEFEKEDERPGVAKAIAEQREAIGPTEEKK